MISKDEFCAVQRLLEMDNSQLAEALGKSRSIIARYRNGDYPIPETIGKAIWLLYGANYGLARVLVAIISICHGGGMVGTGVISEKLYWIGYRFTSTMMPGTSLHALARKGELIHVRTGVYAINHDGKHNGRLRGGRRK